MTCLSTKVTEGVEEQQDPGNVCRTCSCTANTSFEPSKQVILRYGVDEGAEKIVCLVVYSSEKAADGLEEWLKPGAVDCIRPHVARSLCSF